MRVVNFQRFFEEWKVETKSRFFVIRYITLCNITKDIVDSSVGEEIKRLYSTDLFVLLHVTTSGHARAYRPEVM